MRLYAVTWVFICVSFYVLSQLYTHLITAMMTGSNQPVAVATTTVSHGSRLNTETSDVMVIAKELVVQQEKEKCPTIIRKVPTLRTGAPKAVSAAAVCASNLVSRPKEPKQPNTAEVMQQFHDQLLKDPSVFKQLHPFWFHALTVWRAKSLQVAQTSDESVVDSDTPDSVEPDTSEIVQTEKSARSLHDETFGKDGIMEGGN